MKTKLHNVKLAPNCFVAKNCTLAGDITIEAKASVFPGVVMRADRAPIVIGENSNIQDNAVIHVDWDSPTIVGENVTVGHGAIIHGATIGNNTIVGMGSIILDGAQVGKECVIGAGAVVPKGMVIPDGSLVVGIPAKVKGELSAEVRAHGQVSADDYEENAREMADAGFFLRGMNVPEDHPSILLAPTYNYQCCR